jgi:hypothetical protein
MFWVQGRINSQGKLLGGTFQSASTIVEISRVAIDLLANIERYGEETKSRTLHGLNNLLLHVLGPLDVDRDLLDVV